ncbi:MAG TPA: holo-ACP synthase [Bacteroidia bacterium]|nr:holo-ACP synthase [Bacteroidia bacterium]
MIIGLGTDIVETARIEKGMKSEGFKEKIFSKAEIDYCEKKANKFESYAARFAAKEALFKALGTGWRGGLAFNQVEVHNDELGKPYIHLLGETASIVDKRQIKTIHLSLSHVKEMAVATVILEG